MAHHWTPMSMVTRSIRPGEWRVADKRETLGWIRLVHYQGRPGYVCVTRDGWVVCGGDTLRDAAAEFVNWSEARKRSVRPGTLPESPA